MKKSFRSQIVLAATVSSGRLHVLRSGWRGHLQSEVRNVPWAHRHAERRNGQGHGHQARLRSVDAGSHRRSDLRTVKNGKGKMKPIAGLTDPQVRLWPRTSSPSSRNLESIAEI
jgi:hypothetical protein